MNCSKRNYETVLMYQKRQISLRMRYKTARPKQDTGNDGDVISGLQASRKTDFSVIFLLWANQLAKKWYNSVLFIRKNVGDICFSRNFKSWNDVTILPSHLVLYPTGSEILRFWYNKTRGRKIALECFFALLISTSWRFYRANKRNELSYTL